MRTSDYRWIVDPALNEYGGSDLGVGRSTIYRWMADEIFPKPVQLGKRSVGWIEHEIDDWLRSRSR